MNPSEIKKLRTESILKELIPEALANLDDENLKNLCVVDVECKKGRYDAFVYLDKMFFNVHEQEKILSSLKKASRALQNYCMSEQGWYRCPNFHFKFDDRLEYQNHMDALFEKIKRIKMNLEALCKEAELSFYDDELVSENGKKIYRIYVQKEGGVNLDDCAKLSEILSPIFDVEPPVNGEYFLEVSSPGLERKLSKIEHFAKSIGELAKITTNEKEKIEAKIIAVDDENITLENLENKEKTTINFNDIKKARTFIQW